MPDSGGGTLSPRGALLRNVRTFALRAGISTVDLSRYMGASLTMIDRYYGDLARDAREHASKPLDSMPALTTPV